MRSRIAPNGSEARAWWLGTSGWAAGILGLVLIGWAIVPDLLDRGQRNERQAAFVTWCQEQGETECEARVEANHQSCYGMSGGGHRGSRTLSKRAFDTNRYQQCVLLGREAWLIENAKDVREQRARKRRDTPPELR